MNKQNNIIDSVIEEIDELFRYSKGQIVEFDKFEETTKQFIKSKLHKTIKAVLKDVELKEKELSSHFKETNTIRLTRDKIKHGYNQAVSDQKKAHKKYEKN